MHFKTFWEFWKHYFPNDYKKKLRDMEIKKKGIGKVLAKEFIEDMSKELDKILSKLYGGKYNGKT
ncbi:MAG: hypothetical protein ACTSPQ_21910 [Candidatus Helarchaeota archaeon]